MLLFKGEKNHAKSESLSYAGSKAEVRFEGSEVRNILETEKPVRVY